MIESCKNQDFGPLNPPTPKPRALSCTSRALSCTGRALDALDGFDAPGTFLVTLNLFSESFIHQEPRKNCLDDF